MPGREHRLHTNDPAVCSKVESALGDEGLPEGRHQRKVLPNSNPV